MKVVKAKTESPETVFSLPTKGGAVTFTIDHKFKTCNMTVSKQGQKPVNLLVNKKYLDDMMGRIAVITDMVK